MSGAIQPHAWRKFKQAERNMLVRTRGQRTRRNRRAARKWAFEMLKWLNRLF